MQKINLKVRFSKDNITFIIRFIGALVIPILAYFGLSGEDITSWNVVGELLTRFISNPYLIILTLLNAINLIPDPTTKGIADSTRVLNKDSVKQ